MTKEIYSITSNKAPTKKEMEFLGNTIMWATENAIFNIKYINKRINLDSNQEEYTYYLTIYAKNRVECEKILDRQIYDGTFENWLITDEIRLIIRQAI